jgi:energy-coupling factor transporter ATP-binding protein EcfA2
MYLKTIDVENVGPITKLRIELPLQGTLPGPLVLVGPNGSGKSTLLSFIVNALVGLKQQVFTNAEIDQDRVYRVRSTRFLRSGSAWYHVKLGFADGLALEEWVLDRPKARFEKEVSPLPMEAGWKQMGENDSDHFHLAPQRQRVMGGALGPPPPLLAKMFSENAVLFFPSDRFELPDWVNEKSLAEDLKFVEPSVFKGETARRIFSRALLRPNLEWLKGVVLDGLLYEKSGRRLYSGPSQAERIGEFVTTLLAKILRADSEELFLQFADRNVGVISAVFKRMGEREIISNLLGRVDNS